ncbi:MAG: type IV pilus assembly protein FimV, partial [Methylophilaceae bacterium]
KTSTQNLRLSYNIKTAKTVDSGILKKILQEYDALVSRNEFLKVELVKLDEKLVFLQAKLNDLKLLLDKTSSYPQKKVFKNLDTESAKNKSPLQQAEVSKRTNAMFNPINKDYLLLGLLGLLVLLGAYGLKKYRQRLLTSAFKIEPKREEAALKFGQPWQETKLQNAEAVLIDTDTQAEEHNERSILEEAKAFMNKNQPNEAIEHIKWAIRAQPKTAITLWLYLLDIFRQQNLQEDFENYAKALHQTFNVITPVWQEKELAIVVPQSLEEFPHIIEKLLTTWPDESTSVYLRGLITDNRNGERTGFGKAVLDEILLLIMVLETRNEFN